MGEQWVGERLTCSRFRKQPRKVEAIPSKPTDCDCWEEILVDVEGPSNPAGAEGQKYVLTYMCLLCHGVLSEPCEALSASEACN